MWTSSFSDFAKKAQEASEMAAKRAQEASTSMSMVDTSNIGIGSFFNLDSMNTGDNNDASCDNDGHHNNDDGNYNMNGTEEDQKYDDILQVQAQTQMIIPEEEETKNVESTMYFENETCDDATNQMEKNTANNEFNDNQQWDFNEGESEIDKSDHENVEDGDDHDNQKGEVNLVESSTLIDESSEPFTDNMTRENEISSASASMEHVSNTIQEVQNSDEWNFDNGGNGTDVKPEDSQEVIEDINNQAQINVEHAPYGNGNSNLCVDESSTISLKGDSISGKIMADEIKLEDEGFAENVVLKDEEDLIVNTAIVNESDIPLEVSQGPDVVVHTVKSDMDQECNIDSQMSVQQDPSVEESSVVDNEIVGGMDDDLKEEDEIENESHTIETEYTHDVIDADDELKEGNDEVTIEVNDEDVTRSASNNGEQVNEIQLENSEYSEIEKMNSIQEIAKPEAVHESSDLMENQIEESPIIHEEIGLNDANDEKPHDDHDQGQIENDLAETNSLDITNDTIESKDLPDMPKCGIVYEDSPMSKADVSAMNLSMSESQSKCDSEKDYSFTAPAVDDSDSEFDEMYDDGDNDLSNANFENDNDKIEYAENENEVQFNYEDQPEQTAEPNPIPAIPQFAIEKLMSQLERLHTQHEGELQEMERKHQVHVEVMKEKLEIATSSRQSGKNSEVANHDKCLAQLRQFEKESNGRLEQKDEQISDLVEINKLMEEQIEDLKCEADGLNKSLNARNEVLSQFKDKDKEIESLKTSLQATQADLESSNEAFSTLKARVKVVATELKDRRVECRNLNVTVQDLTMSKSALETDNKDISTKLASLQQACEVKDAEIDSFQKNVIELRLQLKIKEKILVEKGSLGEEALTAYKKKAQGLLASANARAAAANQAREDAEIDAINARNEAANAVRVASEAESEKGQIISKALKQVKELQNQIDQDQHAREKMTHELETAQLEYYKNIEELKESQSARDSLLEELDTKEEELVKEIEKNSGMGQDLALMKINNNDLKDEISALKLEMEKTASATFMARQKEVNERQDKANVSHGYNSNDIHNREADAIILMQKQELQVANEVIKDLKESIGMLLSKDPSTVEPREILETMNSFSDDLPPSGGQANSNGGDSTPLFFAFEKQAELNTARDEISRLAALLGDAESSKMEAYEAQEDMRKKMEEAEARLKRFEKLGPVNGTRYGNGLSHSSSFGNRRTPGSSQFHSQGVHGQSISSHNDSSVNLEYLKNIMLRYMNSKTLNEKKALIPVIGAVLELTVDEQNQAMNNVENSAGIQGVGTSLIENVQNKGFVHGLFGDLM